MNLVMNREKGVFPISIGTSLVLESLINQHPTLTHQPANKKPVKRYKQFYVNLRTLFRNLYQSVDNYYRDSIMPSDYFDPFVMELDFLMDWAKNEGEGIEIVFYAVEYRGMRATYPDAKLREAKTPKQLRYKDVEHAIIKAFLENPNYREKFKPMIYRGSINQAVYEDTVILTHYAIDLLSKYKFRKLDLIESHTGKIKSDKEFNSKYLNGESLYMMPFNIQLLQIFGDKETFSPMNPAIKKAVMNLAEEHHWTPITSLDKIKSNVNSIKDVEVKNTLKRIILSI